MLAPTEQDETVPQTNINPGLDPAACQEDERLRLGRKKNSFPFPVNQEGGGRGILGSLVSHHFLFYQRSPPFWHRPAEPQYLHGRLPRHAFSGPSSFDKRPTVSAAAAACQQTDPLL